MLSFYHVTVSKRERLKRGTQWRRVTHSPQLLLSFYSYQKLGSCSRPSTCFSIILQTIPIFCQQGRKLFNIDYQLLSPFHAQWTHPNPPCIPHSGPKPATFHPLAEEQQPTSTILLHTWLISPVNKPLIITTNASLGLRMVNIQCRVLTGDDFTVLVHG